MQCSGRLLGDNRIAGRGMTLLELAIAGAIFSVLILVANGALQSTRVFTRTNQTQVELQEEARHGLESIIERLQATGRVAQTAQGNQTLTYPKIYKSNGNFPNGYANANHHPPKQNPKARPGSNANGGDPTLDSDEIIFKIPQRGANGRPVLSGNTVLWSAEEYGFFICPQTDGSNSIEFRNSAESAALIAQGKPARGEIVARFVDRMQIQDYTADPTLTTRQLRVTLYLARVDGSTQIVVALSGVVDMRNCSQLD